MPIEVRRKNDENALLVASKTCLIEDGSNNHTNEEKNVEPEVAYQGKDRVIFKRRHCKH